MKSTIVDLGFEVIEVEDITDFYIEGEILLAIAPKVDLSGLTGFSAIDDFEFLSIVAICFVFIDVRTIDDESDWAVESLCVFFGAGCFLLDFFSELEQI